MATILILGAGTLTPTPARFGFAYVVENGGDFEKMWPLVREKLLAEGTAAEQERMRVTGMYAV